MLPKPFLKKDLLMSVGKILVESNSKSTHCQSSKKTKTVNTPKMKHKHI